METEAVILTGGESRRMGEDKARLAVGGRPLAEVVAAEFDRADVPVTVLGREPLPGRRFLADDRSYPGPAWALSRFVPGAAVVFVCSCDLPRFRAECVRPIAAAVGEREGAIPTLEGHGQYLCAAYAATVFPEWRHMVDTGGVRSMKELVRVLDCEYLDEDRLAAIGVEPDWLRGVNTPEQLREAMEGRGG